MSKPPSIQPPPSDTEEILKPSEIWWRERQPWLKENGYTLRPRYTPGWVPSWKDKPGIVFWGAYEDGQVSNNLWMIDATTKEGERVCLKSLDLSVDPREPEIMEFFSSPSLSEEPTNHCAPLRQVLEVPDEEELVILVMPILRPWDSPLFNTIGEAVDFIRQLFEGVKFMHKHGVAHRDIKYNNVMMDGSTLYPDGFHFVKQDRTPDFSARARHLTRTEAPPKYYFIDFGRAKKYDISNGPVLDMPAPSGGDDTVPEHRSDKLDQPCDPFKVDVYCTGNLLRRYFTEGYRAGDEVYFHPKSGFDFIKPLIADMVQDDPEKRPTMPEVVERFETIRKSLSVWKLRTRLAEKHEWTAASLARSIPHWGRTARYILQRLPPTPGL